MKTDMIDIEAGQSRRNNQPSGQNEQADQAPHAVRSSRRTDRSGRDARNFALGFVTALVVVYLIHHLLSSDDLCAFIDSDTCVMKDPVRRIFH